MCKLNHALAAENKEIQLKFKCLSFSACNTASRRVASGLMWAVGTSLTSLPLLRIYNDSEEKQLIDEKFYSNI